MEWGIFTKGCRVHEVVGTEDHCRAAASLLSNYEGQFEAKPIAKCTSCDGRGYHEDETSGMGGACSDCDGGYVAVPEVRPQVPVKRRTCSDCGLSPIPPGETCHVGGVLVCFKCASQPPKEITVYATGFGSWWINDTGGGKPVKYVRADLVGMKTE